jgi:hypothetical protein
MHRLERHHHDLLIVWLAMISFEYAIIAQTPAAHDRDDVDQQHGISSHANAL